MSWILALMLMLQVPGIPQGQRNPRQQRPSAGPVNQETDAVATFDGTFKSADKKHVLIDLENGQTLQMFITGATKFIKDGNPVKAAAFQSGEAVTVDASRDARLNLIAVRVEAVKQEKRQPDKQAGATEKNSN